MHAVKRQNSVCRAAPLDWRGKNQAPPSFSRNLLAQIFAPAPWVHPTISTAIFTLAFCVRADQAVLRTVVMKIAWAGSTCLHANLRNPYRRNNLVSSNKRLLLNRQLHRWISFLG